MTGDAGYGNHSDVWIATRATITAARRFELVDARVRNTLTIRFGSSANVANAARRQGNWIDARRFSASTTSFRLVRFQVA